MTTFVLSQIMEIKHAMSIPFLFLWLRQFSINFPEFFFIPDFKVIGHPDILYHATYIFFNDYDWSNLPFWDITRGSADYTGSQQHLQTGIINNVDAGISLTAVSHAVGI